MIASPNQGIGGRSKIFDKEGWNLKKLSNKIFGKWYKSWAQSFELKTEEKYIYVSK